MCQLGSSSAWDRQWIHRGCTMGPWTMHHRQPNNGHSIKSHIFERDLWVLVHNTIGCICVTTIKLVVMISDITPRQVCQSMTGRSVIAGQDWGWMTLADHTSPSAWSITHTADMFSLQLKPSPSSSSFDITLWTWLITNSPSNQMTWEHLYHRRHLIFTCQDDQWSQDFGWSHTFVCMIHLHQPITHTDGAVISLELKPSSSSSVDFYFLDLVELWWTSSS